MGATELNTYGQVFSDSMKKYSFGQYVCLFKQCVAAIQGSTSEKSFRLYLFQIQKREAREA